MDGDNFTFAEHVTLAKEILVCYLLLIATLLLYRFAQMLLLLQCIEMHLIGWKGENR